MLPAPAATGGISRGHCTRVRMPFLWVTVCSQAPQRSPDTPSEQPAQAMSAVLQPRSWERNRAEPAGRSQLPLPKHSGHSWHSTTWPLGKRELWLSKGTQTCLLAITGCGGHGTPWPTPSQQYTETEEQLRQEASTPRRWESCCLN